MNPWDVIIEPISSEKASLLQENDPAKYFFLVRKDSNKTAIKHAFTLIFGITPTKINIANRKPKATRVRVRYPGYSKATKVAYITLAKGQKLAWTEDAAEANTKESSKEKAPPKKGILKKIIGDKSSSKTSASTQSSETNKPAAAAETKATTTPPKQKTTRSKKTDSQKSPSAK